MLEFSVVPCLPTAASNLPPVTFRVFFSRFRVWTFLPFVLSEKKDLDMVQNFGEEASEIKFSGGWSQLF